MLNILRKRAQSTVIQAVVLIIAVVFVFWGVGTNLGNKRNTMATVNGVEIPYQEFQKSYDTAVENMRARFGGSIPPGILEGLDLNRQVLNQLIQAEVLRQGGEEMGITVSKLETQEEIKQMDVFKTNGVFDLNLYKNILTQNRMTPTGFETDLQRDLLARKVSTAINDFAVVTDSHIQSNFAYDNEEIKLAFATVKSSDLMDAVEIKDEDLLAWYDEHKKNYLEDPKVSLQYLFFGYDDDLKDIEISDDAVKKQYELDKQKYFTPEQRHARHILLKVSENDDAAARTEKLKKAEEVLKLAREEGRDFVELAKEYSEGPSAPQGGDLGFFGKGAMVEKFDNAVFAMNPGEISDVVETVFGYHIIKLEEVRPADTRSLDEVRDEIVAELKQKQVKSATLKRATQAYEDIIRSGSLEKYKQANGENKVHQIKYFSRNTPSSGPVSDPMFIQTAFSLKKGELSSLVETKDGYAILFVDDIQEPQAPALSDIHDRVADDYRQEKSRELAREKAVNLLTEASEKQDLAGTVPEDVKVQTSEFIKRSEIGTATDVPVRIASDAFILSSKNAFPEEPVAIGSNFYVFQLLERKSGTESLEETQREQLRTQLLTAKQNELLSDWLAWMQSKADVWVNEQILQ